MIVCGSCFFSTSYYLIFIFWGRSLCFLFFLFVGNIIGGGVLAVSGLFGDCLLCVFFVHLCVCIHKFLFTIFGWVVCLFLLFVLPILIILIFIVCFLQKIRRP